MNPHPSLLARTYGAIIGSFIVFVLANPMAYLLAVTLPFTGVDLVPSPHVGIPFLLISSGSLCYAVMPHLANAGTNVCVIGGVVGLGHVVSVPILSALARCHTTGEFVLGSLALAIYVGTSVALDFWGSRDEWHDDDWYRWG